MPGCWEGRQSQEHRETCGSRRGQEGMISNNTLLFLFSSLSPWPHPTIITSPQEHLNQNRAQDTQFLLTIQRNKGPLSAESQSCASLRRWLSRMCWFLQGFKPSFGLITSDISAFVFFTSPKFTGPECLVWGQDVPERSPTPWPQTGQNFDWSSCGGEFHCLYSSRETETPHSSTSFFCCFFLFFSAWSDSPSLYPHTHSG